MNKEKQIGEMFNIIVDGVIDGEDNNGVPTGNTCANIAEHLYNAGYRKQSEGEWMRSEVSKYDYFCTSCGEKAVQNIYGNYDRLFKFCPNCGAKMKGGE